MSYSLCLQLVVTQLELYTAIIKSAIVWNSFTPPPKKKNIFVSSDSQQAAKAPVIKHRIEVQERILWMQERVKPGDTSTQWDVRDITHVFIAASSKEQPVPMYKKKKKPCEILKPWRAAQHKHCCFKDKRLRDRE